MDRFRVGVTLAEASVRVNGTFYFWHFWIFLLGANFPVFDDWEAKKKKILLPKFGGGSFFDLLLCATILSSP